jgi:hypothetical protein
MKIFAWFKKLLSKKEEEQKLRWDNWHQRFFPE